MSDFKQPDRTYSPEVAEILGRKPAWIVRNGIILIAAVFVLGLACTHFIRYPVVLTIPMRPAEHLTVAGNPSWTTLEARLPFNSEEQLRPGMEVRCILTLPGQDQPLTCKGSVWSFRNTGSGDEARIVLYSNNMIRTAMLDQEQVSIQVIVGQISLLRQIFQPVIALLEGAVSSPKPSLKND